MAVRGDVQDCDSSSYRASAHPVYGHRWGKHWAALTLEMLAATRSRDEPQHLLDQLLPADTSGSDFLFYFRNRGYFIGGLCYALGFDTVLFNDSAPRSGFILQVLTA